MDDAELHAEREMTLRDYLGVVRRRKWLIVVAVVGALIGSAMMSVLQEPIYAADSEILIEPRSDRTVFDDSGMVNVDSLERQIQTEIQLIEGQQVRSQVRDNLQLDRLPPEVSASSVEATDIVEISVRSGDPKTAQILADAYADAYREVRREQAISENLGTSQELQETVDSLQQQIEDIDQRVADTPPEQRDEVRASLSAQRQALISQQSTFNERLDQLRVNAALETGGATVVRQADLPTDPVEPQPVSTAGLAVAVGLILGLVAAFLREHFDDSVAGPDDLQALTTAPVLTVVPVQPPPDNRPVAISEPASAAVEAFRGLRTNVQFVGLDSRMRVIQVTSSLPGEGKTTTATNLAVVLAQAGHQVAYVDADLRKATGHQVFAVPQKPGLTDLLLGDPLDLATSQMDDGLNVIASGTIPPNPSELLARDQTAKTLEELAERFEYVIVDSAPVLPVADSLALAAAVDGVLLVAQARRTSRQNITDSLQRIGRVAGPPIGIVLNQAKGRQAGPYGYGYGYGYGESAP